MKNINLSQIVVVALAVISITFSTYQTYNGYLLAVGDNHLLAAVISLVISFGLIALNIRIWEFTTKGHEYRLPNILLVYLAVASFSMAANFNSFYSQYMLSEIIKDDIEKIDIEVVSLQSNYKAAVKKQLNIERIIEKVNAYKSTLLKQINDRAQPGVGPRAKIILDSLENALGIKLTAPYGSNIQISMGYKEQIEDLLDNKINVIAQEQLSFAEYLEIFVIESQLLIDSMKSRPARVNMIPLLQQLTNEHNLYCERSTSIIGDSSLLVSKQYSYENQEIGKISHSFVSAKKPKYRSAGLLSLALALLIDLITPIVIWFSQRN